MKKKKKNEKKKHGLIFKIFRVIIIAILVVVVLFGALLFFLAVTEYKPAEREVIEPVGNAAATVSEGDSVRIPTRSLRWERSTQEY